MQDEIEEEILPALVLEEGIRVELDPSKIDLDKFKEENKNNKNNQ